MIVAATMVKDEADCIAYTIRHLLAEGVDHVLCRQYAVGNNNFA